MVLDHKKIANGLLALKKIFDKNDIFYWLDFGTLLGAVREGKIIQWDTDADISTKLTDIIKIAKAQSDFQKIGYELAVVNGHYVLRLADTKEHLVDIFINKNIDDLCVRLSINRPFRYFTWILTEADFPSSDYRVYDFDKNFLPNFLIKFLIDFSKKLNQNKREKLIIFIWRLIIKFKLYGKEAIFKPVPLKNLQNFKTITFYGENFVIPGKTDEYLTFMYGNWRVPDRNYTYPTPKKEGIFFK